MRVQGYTHVSLDLASPTRMVSYLRDTFGLQELRRGWYKGEYVRVIGSPHHQHENPGFLWLNNHSSLPQGRLNYIALGINELSVPDAVAELVQKGMNVDVKGGDMLYGPEELKLKIDSFTHPRPEDLDDPTYVMEDAEVDPDLPCLVRGINHLGLDIANPPRMMDWLSEAFDTDGTRQWMRKGWDISKVYYTDGKKDYIGRQPGLMPLFRQAGIPQVRLNHIAFDFEDAAEAITLLEARGIKVDLDGDAMIHGPENIWFQIDSFDRTFSLDHIANDPGVRFTEPNK